MGDLVSFRPRPAGALRTRSEPFEGSAKILFFLGVRYERHVETAKPVKQSRPKGSGTRGSRKRA